MGGLDSRREDDGLSDHLAALGLGNVDRVGASAGSTTNEGVLVGRCPASVADV